ncbi:E3 ubiquitin-protein ligase TRIM39-like [Oncorhynchus kisutch]|uniref:E3 ubiquitin-protein ligase TRIM39-like n=1 Tax=Oncorhynchus kisutch TaxID=8019 RepID=A0A8C7ME13_ONCKI|nr:E3 ubiquitin-protein ligase TRIM39-like [Oncorhynchus kisutch]
MASSSSLLSEEQFLCSICLDVFKEPVSTSCGHNFCIACVTKYWDSNDLCQCPLCKETFYTRPELRVNTAFREVVEHFKRMTDEGKDCPANPGKVACDVCTGTRLKALAKRVIADSMQVFTALVRSIEKSQVEVSDVIEKKQKAAERQAEGLIKELEHEITELKRRSTELEQLSHTEDHLQLLQSFTSLVCTPPSTKDWSEISVHSDLCVGTVRTAVSQLEEMLNKEMEKLLPEVKLKRIQQYAGDVTLDPDTAHPNLILSEDGKQVRCGETVRNLPDNPKRFDRFAIVLGKDCFSSGRFYYEVMVKGKTKWTLGVARESIDRKRNISLSPEDGLWTVLLRDGNVHKASTYPPFLLSLKEKPQKVGVFVDYEEGQVSFYDVEARSHIYSFTGCTFTEKLYPLFSPCNHAGGKNLAPLIISSVNHTD